VLVIVLCIRLCYFVVAIVNESERAHVGWFAKEAKAVFLFPQYTIQFNTKSII